MSISMSIFLVLSSRPNTILLYLLYNNPLTCNNKRIKKKKTLGFTKPTEFGEAMQTFAKALANTMAPKILRHYGRELQACDVFINHRGNDTKHNVAGLLYDHLTRIQVQPFLDMKNLKPGDKLFHKIDAAIKGCKVGIAVFSPRYCDSYFCLHELALMMEHRKRTIPIFYDVKPSQLCVDMNGTSLKHDQLQRFSRAIEEAKYTVGITFDSSNGNWSDLLRSASNAVIDNLVEVDEEMVDESEHKCV